MERRNFSDNIHVTGREFHLQTCTDEDARICTTLFESGKVLARRYLSLDHQNDDTCFHSTVYQKHRQILKAVVHLFELLDDVENIQDIPTLLKMIQFFMQWQLWKESYIVLHRLNALSANLYPNIDADIQWLIQNCKSRKLDDGIRRLEKIKKSIQNQI